MVHYKPHLAHDESGYRRCHPTKRYRHVAAFQVFLFQPLVAITDPLFFLGHGEIGEEVVAPPGAGRDVENAPEDVRHFESDEAESHVGEALALFGELGHGRANVGIVDVQRLLWSARLRQSLQCALTIFVSN